MPQIFRNFSKFFEIWAKGLEDELYGHKPYEILNMTNSNKSSIFWGNFCTFGTQKNPYVIKIVE